MKRFILLETLKEKGCYFGETLENLNFNPDIKLGKWEMGNFFQSFLMYCKGLFYVIESLKFTHEQPIKWYSVHYQTACRLCAVIFDLNSDLSKQAQAIELTFSRATKSYYSLTYFSNMLRVYVNEILNFYHHILVRNAQKYRRLENLVY